MELHFVTRKLTLDAASGRTTSAIQPYCASRIQDSASRTRIRLHLSGNLGYLVVVDQLQDGLRVHEIDADLAILQHPHHDIARQEQADLRVRSERVMGKEGCRPREYGKGGSRHRAWL